MPNLNQVISNIPEYDDSSKAGKPRESMVNLKTNRMKNVNNASTPEYCHHIPARGFDTCYNTQKTFYNKGHYLQELHVYYYEKEIFFLRQQYILKFNYLQVHEQHENGKLL